jgi:hypothetical protein
MINGDFTRGVPPGTHFIPLIHVNGEWHGRALDD